MYRRAGQPQKRRSDKSDKVSAVERERKRVSEHETREGASESERAAREREIESEREREQLECERAAHVCVRRGLPHHTPASERPVEEE